MRPFTRALAVAIAGLAASFGCAHALAADARVPAAGERYAVLALIGDAMTIVTYEPSIGSNLDGNAHQRIALSGNGFDSDADVAVEAAIRRVAADATTTMVGVSDPALTAHSEDLIASPERMKALVAPIAAQLGPDARFLVLVTKHRDDARLRSATGGIGAGKLSGPGFYIDRFRRMTRSDNGETGRGFLAPYAYLSISLVDLATGEVVRTRTVAASTTLSSARSTTSVDPWDALTAERKVRVLQGLVRHAVDVNVPLLLAPT